MARKENQNPQIEQKPGRERREKRSKKKKRNKGRERMLENFAAFEASRKKNKKEQLRENAPKAEAATTDITVKSSPNYDVSHHSEDINSNPFAVLSEIQGRSAEPEKEIDEKNIVDAEIVSERATREKNKSAETHEIVPDISEVREKLNEHEAGTTRSIEDFISALEKDTIPTMEKASDGIRVVRDLLARVTEMSVDISALHNQPDAPEKKALITSLTYEQERAVSAAMGIQSAFEQLRKKSVEEYRQHLRNETNAIPGTLETGAEVSSEIEKAATEVRERDPESADGYLDIIKNSKEKAQAILSSFETTYIEKAGLLDEKARMLTPHIHGIEKAQSIIRSSDIPNEEKQQLRQTYEAVKFSMYDQIAYLTGKSKAILDGGLFEKLTEADIIEDEYTEVTDDMIISSEDIIESAVTEALTEEFGLSEEEIAEKMNNEENTLLLDARDFYGEATELEDLIENLRKDIEYLKEFKTFALESSLSEELPEKFHDALDRINGISTYIEKFATLKEYADNFDLIDNSLFPEEQHEDLAYFRDILAELADEAQGLMKISEKLAAEIKDMKPEEIDEYLDILSDSTVGFADTSFDAGAGKHRSKKAPHIGNPKKEQSIVSKAFDLYFKLLGFDTSKSIFSS